MTEPDAEVTTEPQAQPEPTPRKPWWQHAWAVFGAIIGIVGAITGVVSILPLLFRDATDLDSLTVSVESADAELAPAFAVPIAADWATFPESDAACSTEQLAWLQATGVPVAERYLVSVSNTAKEGATLSLKDFRGEGTSSGAAAQNVIVVCDQTGTGGPNLRAASLDLASGRTAVFRQADPSLPDNPLVFNLAPGESGQFALQLGSSLAFEGTVIFTASVGADTKTLAVPIEGGVLVPGVAPQRLTVTDGRLACAGAAEDCDPFAVIAEFAAAAGGA